VPAELIHCDYRVHAPAAGIGRIARFIAWEQTVEVPESLVSDPHILAEVVGSVVAIEPEPGVDDVFRVRIGYPSALASGQLNQLVNLAYGNVSMYPGIRLVGVDLPDSVLARFAGPRHGIAGIRALLGVHDRPLLATAVKPRGTPIEGLAQLAHDFALGGGDIVKDDQNLVADGYDDFRRRVDACADAVDRANALTGRRCLYLPHLSAPFEEIDRHAAFVRERGLAGVLLCPHVLGLDTARAIAARWGFVYMAHPALSGALTEAGTQGMSHALALGTLLRLGGADISVFVAPGGRFRYGRDDARAIADACRAPLGALPAMFPCPAGGMRYELLPQLARDYGVDSVFLVGGALQAHGPDMLAATRAYRAAIEAAFPGRECAPATAVSSCEFDIDRAAGALAVHLPFASDYTWAGRLRQAYKQAQTVDFAGVSRTELVGRNGEATAFELRYFEIEAGGWTSHERHAHTHVVIAVRGHGELRSPDGDVRLAPFDIAYVPPWMPHQLRASGEGPFGFFCVVDRERDRPQPA
jgi:ribulose-bisphosphate carboxylase large chain